MFELETAAQVQAALKERGVELTEEEILGIRDFIIKVERGEISAEQLEKWAAQGENGELSEEALEQVAGGSITIAALIALVGSKAAITGLVTVVGAAIGAGVAACVDRHGW